MSIRFMLLVLGDGLSEVDVTCSWRWTTRCRLGSCYWFLAMDCFRSTLLVLGDGLSVVDVTCSWRWTV